MLSIKLEGDAGVTGIGTSFAEANIQSTTSDDLTSVLPYVSKVPDLHMGEGTTRSDEASENPATGPSDNECTPALLTGRDSVRLGHQVIEDAM